MLSNTFSGVGVPSTLSFFASAFMKSASLWSFLAADSTMDSDSQSASRLRFSRSSFRPLDAPLPPTSINVTAEYVTALSAFAPARFLPPASILSTSNVTASEPRPRRLSLESSASCASVLTSALRLFSARRSSASACFFSSFSSTSTSVTFPTTMQRCAPPEPIVSFLPSFSLLCFVGTRRSYTFELSATVARPCTQ